LKNTPFYKPYMATMFNRRFFILQGAITDDVIGEF
jgi:hypothetical protein